MTDSVRSWQAQTHSPEPAVPAHTCFLFATQEKEMMNRVQPRALPRGHPPVELSWTQSCQLSPASHITALCGKPRFHHMLRHPANHSIYMIIWKRGSLQPRGTFCDIRYLCWPEKQKWGFRDYSGGKDKKETETLLDKWMTAERVAGQQQGKPCGLLNCIPLRLSQCDDAHDDEDNK